MLASVVDFSKKKGLKEAVLFYLFYVGFFGLISVVLGLGF